MGAGLHSAPVRATPAGARRHIRRGAVGHGARPGRRRAGYVGARAMFLDVAPVFVCTRLLFVALTALLPLWRAATGAPALALRATTDTPATETPLDAWNRWDARWYGDLAHVGYNVRGPHGYANVAFFPLFPLLTRAAHDAVALAARSVPDIAPPGALDPPYLLMGMLVSNVCALGALAYFYRYVAFDHDRRTACRAVTLLAVSPMSFYLFAAYSEGTFLLCAAAFFYAARLRRWWEAGLWGLLAGAARAPGVVLIVPFAMAWAAARPEVVRSRIRWLLSPRPLTGQLASPRRLGRGDVRVDPIGSGTVISLENRWPASPPRARRHDEPLAPLPLRRHLFPIGVTGRALRGALPAAIIPLGMLLFMVYLSATFGDALLFDHAQRAWQRTLAPPWTTLYAGVARPLGDVRRGILSQPDVDAAQDLCYAAIGLFATWRARRLLPRMEGAYLWLVWAIILSSPALLADHDTGLVRSDVLMSLPRLQLMLFPLCTYAALCGRGRLYPWLVIASSLALVFYTLRSLTGAWVA